MSIYLLYLTLCWGAFALLYRAMLSKETFFNSNRTYLLLTLAGGLVLPLLAWQVQPDQSKIPELLLPLVTVGLPEAAQQVGGQIPVVAIAVVGWLWALGAAIGLFRLGMGLFKIAQIARGCRYWEGHVGYHDGIDTPFSFFKWIFIPLQNNAATGTLQETVLRHERAHVQGLHSADVLFCELLCVVFWWHPLAHWYKNTLRNVHEYIADHAAVAQFSKKQYGLLLIQQSQSGPVLAFANHFLQSPLKQRLIMLSKQHSAPIKGFRYALALPIVLFLAFFFQQNSVFAQGSKKIKSVQDVDKVPEYVGGQAALGTFLAQNIKYPEEARKAKASGVAAVQFVVNKTGGVEDVTILKSPHESISAEAIRVVKLTRWTPAMDEGKTVKCQFVLPIKFKLE